MNEANVDHGEIHCMLCGRYLADIERTSDGRMRLIAAPNGEQPATRVRVERGRLHCAVCGGRAWAEWDLLPTSAADHIRHAA